MDGARRVRTKLVTGKVNKNNYLKLYFTSIDGHNVRVQHVVKTNREVRGGIKFEVSLTKCHKPYNHFNDGVLPQIEEMFIENVSPFSENNTLK